MEASYLAGTPSDMSSSMTIVSESLHNGLETAYSTTPLSSAISEHSLVQDVQSYIRELQISLQEVSPVRIFHHANETQKGLTVKNQAYGMQCQNALALYDPSTHSLRTPQCLLFEDSSASSAILPRWGTMRNGVVSGGAFVCPD